MEIVAYLEVAQSYEQPELLEPIKPISERLKRSGKAVATSLGVAATAWTGGLLSSAPALACGSTNISCRPVSVNPCCQPVSVNPCCRPVSVDPCCRPDQVYYQPIRQPIHQPDCNSYCHSESSGGGDYYGEVAFQPYSDGNNLSLGDAGHTVALLQQALAAQGYYVSVDGLFGQQTEAAVMAYQRDLGLRVDGVAGGQTLDSLGLAGAGA